MIITSLCKPDYFGISGCTIWCASLPDKFVIARTGSRHGRRLWYEVGSRGSGLANAFWKDYELVCTMLNGEAIPRIPFCYHNNVVAAAWTLWPTPCALERLPRRAPPSCKSTLRSNISVEARTPQDMARLSRSNSWTHLERFYAISLLWSRNALTARPTLVWMRCSRSIPVKMVKSSSPLRLRRPGTFSS